MTTTLSQLRGSAARARSLWIAAFCLACSPGPERGVSPPVPEEDMEGVFAEIAEPSGLDFVHRNGRSGEYYLFEIMGSGAGLIDYDHDGDLDAYLVQGVAGADGLRDRLYRNDSVTGVDGVASVRFRDVTAEAGIRPRGYGMGLAAGDYDGDGRVDLYVTNFGPNQLFRNLGDGRFEDVTARAGAGDDRWSVSAAFFDMDRDGDLDLYIGNYVDMTVETNKVCTTVVRDYCSPKSYGPVPDRLLRNRGDGTFEDVTASSQLARALGNGLGVVTADLNGDGWIDLYVANDGTPNQCWINRGDGRFEETALLAGCALNEQGDAEAGMGVTAGDFDGDGDEDLFLTHLRLETNTLYVNQGGGFFSDATIQVGLGPASKRHTGFGTAFIDYDNDGLQDLLAVNGAVTADETLVDAGDPYPYHESNQLFRNIGGSFEDVSTAAGPAFSWSEISRGAAFGDVDNDGDVDVLYSNVEGPVRLLRNDAGRGHWIGLDLVRAPGETTVLGTRVEVRREGRPPIHRRVRADGSYASANDPRIVVGLGDHAEPVTVLAEWPDGRTETWRLEIDRWVTLVRGTGSPESDR